MVLGNSFDLGELSKQIESKDGELSSFSITITKKQKL